jgi:hypothetical protein
VPIAKLFIEGALEAEVLYPILQGNPVLQRGGSKNSLKPRARTERQENKVAAGYLRDRDFDFDPPSDLTKPTIDEADHGVPFGWRWCRHEIENYLIDPAVISEGMSWPTGEIEEAIREAARTIRNYEAARWTVGTVRRALPPNYELQTRPDGLNELELPSALDSSTVSAWASNNIESHRERIITTAEPTFVKTTFDSFTTRFDDAFIADVANVLLWFSGKDILAGMASWLITRSVPNPGAFRAATRDWLIANPVRALELLPEWKGMTEILRA